MPEPIADKTTYAQEAAEGHDETLTAAAPAAVPDDAEPAADAEPDEETGASPGTAQACSDLGLNSLTANLAKFGIKPPGQS